MRPGRAPLIGFLAAGIALVVALAAPVGAATISGGDKGGADITVANGDVLSGTFTNVGTFTIPAGVTAFVEPGTALSITATTIVIDGVLDGSGAGFAGGQASNLAHVGGNPGAGPGAGAGGSFGACVHGSGGGGAGYGGAGGKSSESNFGGAPAAAGGPTYGTGTGSDIAAGSGGGSGANFCADEQPVLKGGDGGAGGASITLVGEVHLTGSILANGKDGADGAVNPNYGTPGGGGGSGGGVLLNGKLFLDGTISAKGGTGGDGTPGDFAQAGGGGGGGRIKLFGCADLGAAFAATRAGGIAGTASGTGTPGDPGAAGTFAPAPAACPAAPVIVVQPAFTG